MTDTELLDRVTAWLASRGLTPTPGEGLWDACSGSWGASSPPALGCLQALAEAAHGFPLCAYQPRMGGWCIESAHDHGQSFANDPSESRKAAWVAALEAAPQVTT